MVFGSQAELAIPTHLWPLLLLIKTQHNSQKYPKTRVGLTATDWNDFDVHLSQQSVEQLFVSFDYQQSLCFPHAGTTSALTQSRRYAHTLHTRGSGPLKTDRQMAENYIMHCIMHGNYYIMHCSLSCKCQAGKKSSQCAWLAFTCTLQSASSAELPAVTWGRHTYRSIQQKGLHWSPSSKHPQQSTQTTDQQDRLTPVVNYRFFPLINIISICLRVRLSYCHSVQCLLLRYWNNWCTVSCAGWRELSAISILLQL